VSTLRYWAAARAAAGMSEQELPGGTLAELLAAARAGHDARLGGVLDRCSFLVDGDPVGARPHESVPLRPSSVVDALPPFAGGCSGSIGSGTIGSGTIGR